MRRVRFPTKFGVLILFWSLSCIPSTPGPPPNIVVILLDTLRPDALGIYGHEPDTAPFVSSLSEQAAVFERAFSTSSWTAPSTASLFTSTYPWEHGVTFGFHAHRWRVKALREQGEATLPLNRLPDELSTLPELLKTAGYSTFGMASNRNVSEELGFDRGFDRFLHRYQAPIEEFSDELKLWKDDLDQAQPYFLYLHLNDVHAPYEAREPYIQNYQESVGEDEAGYLSEIGHVDRELEGLIDLLKVDDSTLLIVLSDHGEEFEDHGGLGHGPQLYIELNRVVMMFRGPSLGIVPQRLGANVSLIDVLPTVVELIGLTPISGARGLSLAPLLQAGKGAKSLLALLQQRTLFAHRVNEYVPEIELTAAIRQNWRLIRSTEGTLELFDNGSDPAEQKNIYGDEQRIADSLSREIDQLLQSTLALTSEKVEIPLDEELVEELEALGYIE